MDIGFQTTIDYGGVGRFSAALVTSLSEYCDKITVYPTPLSVANPRDHDWWRDSPSNVVIKKRFPIFRSYLRDLSSFKNHDVVHVNYATFGSAAAFTSLLDDTPCVYTIHTSQDIDFRNEDLKTRITHDILERRVFLPLMVKNSTPVTVSNYNRNRIEERTGTVPNVIYHGVDNSHFRNNSDNFERRKYGIRDESKIVLFVGRFYPSKGATNFVRSIPEIKSTYNGDIDFVLVGGGEEEDKIRSYIGSHNLDNVHILTDLEENELSRLYNDANIFALPSTSETFGLVFLEAMASGTPIVFANAGSAPEIVGDAGIGVEPHHPSRLASAIASLLGDDDLYSNLQNHALDRASDFNWEDSAEEYYNLYRTIA